MGKEDLLSSSQKERGDWGMQLFPDKTVKFGIWCLDAVVGQGQLED